MKYDLQKQTKAYHIVGTVPNSIRKIIETETHKYMTTHFPAFVETSGGVPPDLWA